MIRRESSALVSVESGDDTRPRPWTRGQAKQQREAARRRLRASCTESEVCQVDAPRSRAGGAGSSEIAHPEPDFRASLRKSVVNMASQVGIVLFEPHCTEVVCVPRALTDVFSDGLRNYVALACEGGHKLLHSMARAVRH
eukprot:scaffold2404_cov398-Prasinococcus_capsulatus_cf.AAC.25